MEEKEDAITCDVRSGGDVEQAVEEAIQLSRIRLKKVCFKMNHIAIQVEHYTIADAVVRDYYRAINKLIPIPEAIGPDCEYPLSAESIAMDKKKIQEK